MKLCMATGSRYGSNAGESTDKAAEREQ